MLWLFSICSDPYGFDEFGDVVQWLSQGKNGFPNDFLDTIIVQSTWAPSGMAAELCLHVARRLIRENGESSDELKTIIQKGLHLTRIADSRIKDKSGNVKLKIAHDMNEPILGTLEKLALQLISVTLDDDENVNKELCLDIKLPPSYIVPPKNKNISNLLLGD